MRSEEFLDAATLAGDAAVGIARTVQHTQEAVTEAAYEVAEAALGSGVTPIRHMHRGVLRGIHACVRLGLRTAAAVAGHTTAARFAEGPAAEESERTQIVLRTLNGLFGDRLTEAGSRLAVGFTLRKEGRPVAMTAEGLRTAYGAGDRRLAVFVHGLVEDESSWTYRAARFHAEPGTSLPRRIEEEFGYLPLYVRYNTGASVADNGAALSALLDGVVASWSGRVTDILLVGHSMGGLVIHSALVRGTPRWTRLSRRVVALGSPSEGAPLERLADAVARTSVTIPTTVWLGDVLGARSRGIVDLGRAMERPPSGAPVRELAVYGSLSPWPHPVIDRLGDGMVPVPAPASTVPGLDTITLRGVGHEALLNHPRVHDPVLTWLAE